jgi:hypothetical protein
MAQAGIAVMTQRENEKGKREALWRGARYGIDQMTGTITVTSVGALAKKWVVTLRPEQIEAFTIDLISDTNTLAMMYGGGLLGYGVAAIMGRWVKMPVMIFHQPMAEPGQQWIQIRAGGMSPRKQLREMATNTVNFLRERNYPGMLPDVNDETLWKAPTVAILVGCGVVMAVVVCIVAVLIAIGAYSN